MTVFACLFYFQTNSLLLVTITTFLQRNFSPILWDQIFIPVAPFFSQSILGGGVKGRGGNVIQAWPIKVPVSQTDSEMSHLESCCVNDYHYKMSHNKTTQDSVLKTTSIHHRSVGLLGLPSFKLLTGRRSAPRLSSSLDWQQSEWNSLSDIWLRHKSS